MSDNDNDNVVELGAHERMKPNEALGLTMRENPPEVLILFYDSAGVFGMRSSNMSRKDALWILETAKDEVLSSGPDWEDPSQ